MAVNVVGQDEGDELRRSYAYQYDWIRNGEETDAPSQDFLDSVSTSRGDEWQVRVTPVWGQRRGTSVTSDPIVINNSPPKVISIAFEPTAPGSHEDLTAIVETLDSDGEDPVFSLNWLQNGTPVSVTGLTVPAEQTNMDDIWTLEVTAIDAFDNTVLSCLLYTSPSPRD